MILIPGQAPLLQLSDFSSVDPSELQFFPPFCGAGLSQFRVFVRVPPPQVTVQGPQTPQEAQEPSTLLFSEVNKHKLLYIRFISEIALPNDDLITY